MAGRIRIRGLDDLVSLIGAALVIGITMAAAYNPLSRIAGRLSAKLGGGVDDIIFAAMCAVSFLIGRAIVMHCFAQLYRSKVRGFMARGWSQNDMREEIERYWITEGLKAKLRKLFEQ